MVVRLRQIRAAKAPKRKAVSKSIPAPTGGWNARDSIAEMDRLDAVTLVNWFPTSTDVIIRRGSFIWSGSTTYPVETVMAYTGAVTRKLFAVSNGIVYETTNINQTDVSLTGLSNSRLQFVNLATTGGNYLMFVNGVDQPMLYSGTAWSVPAITGATTTGFVNINLHKNRVWFIEKGTLKAWYLPTASIAGAANSLDLSAFFPRGGVLVAMATWTIDAGFGIDDLAVFISSNGEVAVYRGTDPSSSSTWALVGVYWIGSPVGYRCYTKFSGDCLLITQDGIVPLSGALQSSRTNPRVAISDKIQSVLSESIAAYGNNFGWQIINFPKQSMLVVNVPIQENVKAEQYVMNTITGAWCRFTGWNATCFELLGDDLYYGDGPGVGVRKAWNGYADIATPGAPFTGLAISASALQAFNYFGDGGQTKRFLMMRPTFLSNTPITLSANVNVDYNTAIDSSGGTTLPLNGAALWDAGVWDSAVWQDGLQLSRSWIGATGVGYAGAPAIYTSSSAQELHWISTDITMEPGGIL